MIDLLQKDPLSFTTSLQDLGWHCMRCALNEGLKSGKWWIRITDVNPGVIPISDVHWAPIYNLPRIRMEIEYIMFESTIDD